MLSLSDLQQILAVTLFIKKLLTVSNYIHALHEKSDNSKQGEI